MTHHIISVVRSVSWDVYTMDGLPIRDVCFVESLAGTGTPAIEVEIEMSYPEFARVWSALSSVARLLFDRTGPLLSWDMCSPVSGVSIGGASVGWIQHQGIAVGIETSLEWAVLRAHLRNAVPIV